MAADEIERRYAVNGDEVDAHGRMRRFMRWQRGELAKVKRLTNHRERQERKRAARQTVREETA